MQFYTYGNIVRILKEDKTLMVDVNIDEGEILSSFDASRPFDAAFIQSFLNILSSSSCGFKLTSDKTLINKAMKIAQILLTLDVCNH